MWADLWKLELLFEVFTFIWKLLNDGLPLVHVFKIPLTIGRDAANTWEMDTPVKQPDVLFSRLLGSMAHDRMLKVPREKVQLKEPI
nr:hypothetical protein CFP56_32807 [Quercus suber]